MLDDLLLRPLFTFLLKLFFRLEVTGLEHYRAAGDKVLILSNHQSFIEPIIIATLLPEKPAFAVNIFQGARFYFRVLDKMLTFYRLDPSKPLSMKHLIQDLRKGKKVVIFPEGRITTSGGIMKIYDGTRMLIEKTGATVLPVRIDGAEYSKFSFVGGKVRQRWFPKIRMTVLPPVKYDENVSTQDIYDLLTRTGFEASGYRRTLLSAMVAAYRWHGGGHVVACDINRKNMGYRQLFTRAHIVSEKLSVILSEAKDDNRYIGVMLPSAIAAPVVFVALHLLGKIPCMLNFSAGEANILHACHIATVRNVITSREFVEKGKLEGVVAALQKHCNVIFLEDIKPMVTPGDKLRGLWHGMFPAVPAGNADDPAVVLYTSGSEGAPKGVALSHANILGNIEQAAARLDLTTSDRLFNAMPVFHSFGLTIGMILPLVKGIRTFLYPSPLHYRIIPELVYDTDATVMLGTDTFYNGYARYAHPYDFWNIRLAVAGAEKLRDVTREMYIEKFRVIIVEGYGVTEASPVVAVNTPMEHKTGSVGRALPGIECKLEVIPGMERGGRLLVRGPNIMLGYLKADQPGVIQPQGEWYDTGDIVEIDAQGFITILGRAKRFAKIAGEMVSLMAVEELAAGLFADVGHAAIAVPDERKGEQVVLYTESAELTREMLLARAREKGVAEICLPKQIIAVAAIPRLGTGKIDYVTLGKIHFPPF
jgi:acyl-[acyl-carrier-protein]-phospholipid O-acyltransferase/long-chain-fatty-acid--[acyl-carrier-protein] ligase